MKRCVYVVFIGLILWSCGQGNAKNGAPVEVSSKADTILIKDHLTAITKTEGFRNYQDLDALNAAADYIESVFRRYADTTYFQPYMVYGKEYKNVVCRFNGKKDKPLIVVGAHYDVCGDQPGADDNASGVVGLLEIARMLKGKTLSHPIEIVAYTLEEPPFFRTENMGSYIHAESLNRSKTPVYGMVCLEMIGYFDDRAWSQQYPVKVMKVAYGKRGDYVLLSKRMGAGDFVNKFSKQFNNIAQIETKNLSAPSKIEGTDFSDHLNYWKFNYDALMVTNTAFYRNNNYHQPTDTMETLDIARMAEVINATFAALIEL